MGIEGDSYHLRTAWDNNIVLSGLDALRFFFFISLPAEGALCIFKYKFILNNDYGDSLQQLVKVFSKSEEIKSRLQMFSVESNQRKLYLF